jgi:hypothetical protein
MNGDPLGINEAIGRDMERVSRVLGRGPLLPVPIPRGNGQPAGDPRTPPELFAGLPDQVSQTAQAGVELLGRLPSQVAEDLTVAANNLLRVPREITGELFKTPGLLAQRLAPSNINSALATVRDSADFKNVANPREMREKMRTITDVIDLFTPT